MEQTKSGTFGDVKFVQYGKFGLALKYFKRHLDDKGEFEHALIQTDEATNEFKLEAIHEKRFETYIVRAFELKFDAKSERMMIVAERAVCDLTGQDFIDVLKPNREEIRWQVLHDCLRGLQALVSIGGLHRDIKPQNILFFKRKDDKVAFKLGDLGAASPSGKVEQNFALLGTYPPPLHYYMMNKFGTTSSTMKRTYIEMYTDWNMDSVIIDLYAMALVSAYLDIVDDTATIRKLDRFAHTNLEKYNYIQPKQSLEFIMGEREHEKLDDLNGYLNSIVQHVNGKWIIENVPLFKKFFDGPANPTDAIWKVVNSDTVRDFELTNDAEYIYPDTSVTWICDALAATSIKQTNAGSPSAPPPAPAR